MVDLVERNPSQRQKVTDVLIEFIRDDSNFDNLRDVRIDIAAMKYWKDYQDYLSKNMSEDENDLIISKYIRALHYLHEKDKSYYDRIEYDIRIGYVVPYYSEQSNPIQLHALVTGFSSHVQMIKEKDRRERYIEFFEKATNPTLTKQLIEANFLPKP